MIKLFNWVIISSDEYDKIDKDYTSKMKALGQELVNANTENEALQDQLIESQRLSTSYYNKVNKLNKEIAAIEKDLKELQQKAFIRGEKGRFIKYLKFIANAEDNTNK